MFMQGLINNIGEDLNQDTRINIGYKHLIKNKGKISYNNTLFMLFYNYFYCAIKCKDETDEMRKSMLNILRLKMKSLGNLNNISNSDEVKEYRDDYEDCVLVLDFFIGQLHKDIIAVNKIIY